MTVWTPPNHVSAGDASSSQFNVETVDNLVHLWERTRGAFAFSGTTSVATGLGASTTIAITEALANTDIDYSVTAGVVTLNDAGIYLVTLTAVFASGATGTLRWARVLPSSVAEPIRDGAPPSTTPTPGVSGAGVISVPAGETLQVEARHDQGANLNVTARLGLVLLTPT